MYISLTISVFLIRQKLDKHTDSPGSRYQSLGWFHFWNLKIFEGVGVLRALFCPERTWGSGARMPNSL